MSFAASSGGPDKVGPNFKDGKAEGAMRTIGEVSAAFGIKPHVLRYWESKFPMLTPLKRSGGRRLYRSEDVSMVEAIDRLVNREGYTLKGARKALQAGNVPQKQSSTTSAISDENPPDAATIARQLRSIRDRLSAALDA